MNPIRRYAVIAVSSGVAVASLALPSTAFAKTTPTTTNPAAAAAGYLARKLVGTHHNHYDSRYSCGTAKKPKTCTYVNYGETADAILSMDAAGVAQAPATRATEYLQDFVKSYVGSSASDYAPGAIGKLMLVAEAQHVSVRSFGGVNLVAALASTEGVRGALPGEYQQNPEGTPDNFLFFSTVSEALPVLALADSSATAGQPDAAAVAFLAAQQCTDGGFPSQLLTDTAAACTAGEDVDSTAYAAQALLAVGSAASQPALRWLVTHENADGGYGKPSNANSTAIAVEALVAGHRNVHRATVWLQSHQLRCKAKASERGAVTFENKYDASALLATSQAAAALALRPLSWIDKGGASANPPALKC
ncbi:MAG TPA: hypothetical protein VHV76_03005 [Mycobacteriales bacterium]|nr:hypothetical protein [Mycobacteriales bacterium]